MAGIHDLKKENIQKIRACFYQGGIWTKNDLSMKTGLSLAGTTNILQFLCDEKEILLTGKADSTGGRKSKQYMLNGDQSFIMNVILIRYADGYRYKVSVLKLNGDIVHSETIEGTDGSLDELRGILDKVNAAYTCAIAAVSVPGVCKNGVTGVCDFENLSNMPLQQGITDHMHIPCIMENDVNIACIGFAGKHPEIKDLVFVYQPSVKYVGCGIIIDRKLYHGFSCAAGELRYLPDASDAIALNESPKTVLQKQLLSICAVMNPEMIGYHSDLYQEEELVLPAGSYPQEDMPQLVNVKDFYDCIDAGLYQMSLSRLLYEKMEES